MLNLKCCGFEHYRWRDVKLHAFDDAKPRTYVDLKDKWKTLVHTARISPQQRRGELVPHELLDHVMADEHEKDLVEMLQENHPIDISKYANYVKFCPQRGCP
ncbi:putative telomere repeat-binding protein, plant [Helianthus annuus]|nr:putative telomere repeat-binding protein, plant [Helianthus annuus]